MTKRTTIIDFVNEYVDKYQNDTYLREKVDGVWTETSFIKTRDEARLIAVLDGQLPPVYIPRLRSCRGVKSVILR